MLSIIEGQGCRPTALDINAIPTGFMLDTPARSIGLTNMHQNLIIEIHIIIDTSPSISL